MKRYLAPLVILIIGLFAYVYGGVATYVRHEGVSTANNGMFVLAQDSADTFAVDTTWSDTVTIDQTKDWLGYILIRDTIVLADSANDSVIITVNVWTSADAGFARILQSQTFTADLTRDTLTGQAYIGTATITTDSLTLDKLWFETIVSDSFIAGAGQSDNDDSTLPRLRYFVIQK